MDIYDVWGLGWNDGNGGTGKGYEEERRQIRSGGSKEWCEGMRGDEARMRLRRVGGEKGMRGRNEYTEVCEGR